MRATLVKIDPVKLQDRIILAGHTNTELSQLMGFNYNYLTQVLRRGSIAQSGLQLLAACGVNIDGLVEESTKPMNNPSESRTDGARVMVVTLTEDDYKRLYNTIVKAVKNGIKYGFEEADK